MIRTFDLPVRIGNWFEDEIEEEACMRREKEKESEFQRICDMLELLMLKKDFKNLSKDSRLNFNEPYLIKCNLNNISGNGRENIHSFCLSLGCVLHKNAFNTELDLYDELISSGSAVGSKNLQPSFRNCFYLKSADDPAAVRHILYGETVYLCLQRDVVNEDKSFLNDCANVVAIGSRPPTLGEPRLKCGGFNVFCEKFSKETEIPFEFHWKIEHLYPRERLEHEATPIKVGDKVIIKHLKTNQALSLEPNVLKRNIFGIDYEVHVKTKLNSHKAEEETNIWLFSEPTN